MFKKTQVEFYFEGDLSQEVQCIQLAPLSFIKCACTADPF